MDATRSAEHLDHLAVLTALTGQFAQVLRDTPLDARPVALAPWDLAALGVHLGEVHQRVATIVETGRRPPRSDAPEVSGSLPVWYERARERLLDVLARTDPQRACPVFEGSEAVVRFWHRRQVHETLVHLWDARSAIDPHAPPLVDVDPAVSADGVDEVLTVYPARVAAAERGVLPGTLVLHATDAGRSWTVMPDWAVLDGAHGPSGAEVRANAGALLLHVWRRRRQDAGVEETGDRAVHAAFGSAPVIT